jgi:hypothetical protein
MEEMIEKAAPVVETMMRIAAALVPSCVGYISRNIGWCLWIGLGVLIVLSWIFDAMSKGDVSRVVRLWDWAKIP